MSAVTRLEEWLRRQSGMPHAIAVDDDPMEAALRGIGYDEWCTLHPEAPVFLLGYVEPEKAAERVGGSCLVRTGNALTENACGAIMRHAGAVGGMITLYMPELVRECMRRGMWLVEDCSYEYGGYVGHFGNASIWRYPTGGVVVTCDLGIAERVRSKMAAMTEDHALDALEAMGERWRNRYPESDWVGSPLAWNVLGDSNEQPS